MSGKMNRMAMAGMILMRNLLDCIENFQSQKLNYDARAEDI